MARKPRPFFRPAVDAAMREIRPQIEAGIQKALEQEIQPQAIDPRDVAALEYRERQIRAIARFFAVPRVLLPPTVEITIVADPARLPDRIKGRR